MPTARLIPVLLCGAALIGCEAVSEPESTVPDPELSARRGGNTDVQQGGRLIGSWRMRSALIDDVEAFAGTGASATLTFRSDDTYSYVVSGDVDHLMCEDPATSCTVNGVYAHTSYAITFIDDDGPDSGNYAFCGNRLIYLDGNASLTFVRTRRTR
jgi:hypothetical protein